MQPLSGDLLYTYQKDLDLHLTERFGLHLPQRFALHLTERFALNITEICFLHNREIWFTLDLVYYTYQRDLLPTYQKQLVYTYKRDKCFTLTREICFTFTWAIDMDPISVKVLSLRLRCRNFVLTLKASARAVIPLWLMPFWGICTSSNDLIACTGGNSRTCGDSSVF